MWLHGTWIWVEIFSLPIFFTQCRGVIVKQFINLRKVRTENLKFRTDLRDWAMDGWSVTQWGWLCCLQIAQKIVESKTEACSSQCRYLHHFQTEHFICCWFGYKLWLLSIQNHGRDSFQAFAHSHLKLLCCLIEIWADGLFWARSPI